jgi:hypothetical protein
MIKENKGIKLKKGKIRERRKKWKKKIKKKVERKK